MRRWVWNNFMYINSTSDIRKISIIVFQFLHQANEEQSYTVFDSTTKAVIFKKILFLNSQLFLVFCDEKRMTWTRGKQLTVLWWECRGVECGLKQVTQILRESKLLTCAKHAIVNGLIHLLQNLPFAVCSSSREGTAEEHRDSSTVCPSCCTATKGIPAPKN